MSGCSFPRACTEPETRDGTWKVRHLVDTRMEVSLEKQG